MAIVSRALRLVRDEPGALALEGEPQWPPGGTGPLGLTLLLSAIAVVAVLSLFASSLYVTGGTERSTLYGVLATLAAGVLLGIAGLRATRGLVRIELDRGAGVCRIEERALLGLFAREREHRLADIERATLEYARELRSVDFERAAPLRLRFLARGSNGLTEEVFVFRVERLDRREEVFDLGLRLGRIAGFAAYRLARGGPAELEVELLRRPEAGTEPVPGTLAPADYEGDRIAVPVPPPPEGRLPAFNPAAFASPYRVVRWDPGRDIRLEKPWGWTAILEALAVQALVLGVLALLWAVKGRPEIPRDTALLLVGLFLGMQALAAIVLYRDILPARTAIDWAARTVSAERTWRRTELHIDGLEQILVRGVRTELKSGVHYCCNVYAIARGASGGLEGALLLVNTASFRDDPLTPHRMALPLAADLACARGVPYLFIDYDYV